MLTTKNTDPDNFVGFPYGMTNTEATPIAVDEVSMPGNIVYAPQAPSFYMNYAEVCFIMAEACEKLGIAGDAETWYYAGIEASCEMWNELLGITPTGWYRIDNNNTNVLPNPITADDIAAYKAGDLVVWDAGKARQLIAEQKYIALYPQGLQAWFEWRRTGYPDCLIKPGDEIPYTVGSISGTYIFTPLVEPGARGIPVRMTYPSEENELNKTNYLNAVSAQGSDDFDTKTWWDPFI